MEYEGWTTEVAHEGCDECEACVGIAYGFAVDWGSTAHQHSQWGDDGLLHVGIVRRVPDDGAESS